MAETSGRRRPPQKYPDELRQRAVRMVFEAIDAADGQRFGVVTRVAKQSASGPSRFASGSTKPEVDAGRRQGTSTAEAKPHR